MSDVEQRRRLRPRQSAVSRADLLWLLHVLGDEDGAEAAGLLGFRRAEVEAPEDEPMPPMPRPPRKPEPRVSARRPPLRATHFAVVEQQRFQPAPIEDEGSGQGPIFESVASKPAQLPPRTSLSPARRLAVLLRHQLRLPRAGSELDTARLLEHLARGRALPRHLPRLSRPHWGADAALVIDFSLPAMPLREDLIDLADVAHTLSAGRLTVLWRDPSRGWLQRQPGRGADWREVGEAPLVRARTWLLAGNAGSLSPDQAASRAWRMRIKRHLRSGGQVAMLAGGFTPDWRQSLPRQLRLALWERGRRPVPGRAMAANRDGGGGDVDRLLAALSLAVVVEPALLRDVRLALGLSTACELAAWNHRHVENCAIGMQLRRDQLTGYRERLKRVEPLHVRQRLAQTIARHHAAHSQLIRMEEAALAAEIAGWQTESAQEQWRMAARTLERAPASTAAQELSSYLERTGLRAHPGLWPAVPALADAYVIARRDALRQGAAVPEGMPAANLGRHLASNAAGGAARPLWIVRRGTELMVRSQPPEDGDFTLLESPPTNGFELEAPGKGRHWQPLAIHPVRLDALLSGAGPWTIRTPWVEALIAEIPRPSWALGWEFDREGLHAWAPSPLGQAVRLDWFPPGYGGEYRWPLTARGFNATGVPIGDGVWMGADLEYGLYLDVPFGNATQRFRYIEPGEFLMGSPDTEPQHSSDEGPQHVVRLTEGFWLAETACSQAVWAAVTGSNPSRFKDDPQNPVEQVSWDDVQDFLQKMGELLPGVKADLPTEAEWEYACRAGTETAFNWGDGITPAQANYDGSHAYAAGPTGEYREKTVPVKSFAPNAWGLYQMHGNVDEWCADGMRPYDGERQENPRGETGDVADAPRVVRGGSWYFGPRWLRAAYRDQWRRGGRYVYLGFRFSLRSTSLAKGAERLPEAAAAPEGAQGMSPAPGRSRSVVAEVDSPARRDAGPATISEKLKSAARKLFGFDKATDTPKRE